MLELKSYSCGHVSSEMKQNGRAFPHILCSTFCLALCAIAFKLHIESDEYREKHR